MSGYTPARRAENSIWPWQYLAVAGSSLPLTPDWLKIRWICCTEFDIYVVFQGLIKTLSRSTLGCHIPGFVTHSLIPLSPVFVRTVPCPWFNCSVRPCLVPSRFVRPVLRPVSRPLLSHPNPRGPSSAALRQISKQRTLTANHSHCNVGLCRLLPCESLFGHFA